MFPTVKRLVAGVFDRCAAVMSSHGVTSHDENDVEVTSSSATAASSTAEASRAVLKTTSARSHAPHATPTNPLSIGYVTAALVLGLLCLILGLVYGYIHFTRVSPRFRAARMFDHGVRCDAHSSSTHIFLRNSK